MKKEKILSFLVGIIISICPNLSRSETDYSQVLDQIKINTGQTSLYTGRIDDNSGVIKTDVHNILSRTETIANNTSSLSGTTETIRGYLYDVYVGSGREGSWFRNMYDLSLQLQTLSEGIKSTLEDLESHVTTTQKYQLDEIKDNTSDIETNTDVMKTHTESIMSDTETIASDTSSLSTNLEKLYNSLFVDTSTKSYTTVNPSYSSANIDLKNPKQFLYVSGTRTWANHLIEMLRQSNLQQSQSIITETSSLYNLQAIRTNLNTIAKNLSSNGVPVVDTMADLSFKVMYEYGKDVDTSSLPTVDVQFTGEFHKDLLRIVRANTQAQISDSYANISVLTNLQELLARNADAEQQRLQEEFEDSVDDMNKEAQDAEDVFNSEQYGQYFTYQNESTQKYTQDVPKLGGFTTDTKPQHISFSINPIRLNATGETPPSLDVFHQMSEYEDYLFKAIRGLCTFLVWSLGLFFSYVIMGYAFSFLGFIASFIHGPRQFGAFLNAPYKALF